MKTFTLYLSENEQWKQQILFDPTNLLKGSLEHTLSMDSGNWLSKFKVT